MKLSFCITLEIKFNPKWIKDLKIKAKTIGVLDEDKGVTPYDPGLGGGFLDAT